MLFLLIKEEPEVGQVVGPWEIVFVLEACDKVEMVVTESANASASESFMALTRSCFLSASVRLDAFSSRSEKSCQNSCQ